MANKPSKHSTSTSNNNKKTDKKKDNAKDLTKAKEVQNYSTLKTMFNNYVKTGGDDSYSDYVTGYTDTLSKILSNTTFGIEGIPYQFLPSVDRRVSMDGSIKNNGLGRKYTEKIFSRMPLLFLTPCRAEFMKGFSKDERKTVISALIDDGVKDSISDLGGLLEHSGSFYTPVFAYKEYYQYLNTMLRSLAYFMGIADEEVEIGMKNGKRKRQKLGAANWQYDLDEGYKTFFASQENLLFYMDNFNTIDRTFSNDFGDSSLASIINGMSDMVNEVKFLFGSSGGAVAKAIETGTEVADSLSSKASELIGKLGGGVLESLANGGVHTILNGGKIIFPQIWQNSSASESYSLTFKFRTPNHDKLSIFMDVLKPYCKLLCLTMPQQDTENYNGFQAPFLVRASCKGMFNIEFGAITGLSVTEGAECQWNDDGLPTQIDVSVDIQNLYQNLSISKTKLDKLSRNVVNNTAYMDFICNMAGLNIAQMEIGRKIKMQMFLSSADIASAPASVGTRFSQGASNIMGSIYNMLS